LGTRTKDEGEKWKASALAKVLINEESPSTRLEPEKFSIGKVNVPKHLGFGVDTAEKEMLFNVLPKLTAEMAVQKEQKNMAQLKSTELEAAQAKLAAEMKLQEKTQLDKANMFAKVLDLQNANAQGVAFVNRRRVVSAFSAPDNPFNPGRTEVQVALMTYKIRKVWRHLLTCKRDKVSRRNLRKLVHQRAKILRYLKIKSRVRYESLLTQLALEPGSVEGELVI